MRKKLTTKEFIQKASHIHANKFDYSKSDYVKCEGKVEIICPLHGSFLQQANVHLYGHGCPGCKAQGASDRRSLKLSDFIEAAHKVHGNRFDYSKSIYLGSCQKLEIICPDHGSFWTTPASHIHTAKTYGCYKCAMKQRKNKGIRWSTEEFANRMSIIHNNRYSYENMIYVNSDTKIEIICKDHGSFWQDPGNHGAGSGCPVCKSSKGELKIFDWLKSNHIDFCQEHNFNKTCKSMNGGLCYFDFYLPSLQVAIEFDGEHHYHACQNRGGEEAFCQIQIQDKFKTEWCRAQGVRLIRIPYWDLDKISEILTQELIK